MEDNQPMPGVLLARRKNVQESLRRLSPWVYCGEDLNAAPVETGTPTRGVPNTDAVPVVVVAAVWLRTRESHKRCALAGDTLQEVQSERSLRVVEGGLVRTLVGDSRKELLGC